MQGSDQVQADWLRWLQASGAMMENLARNFGNSACAAAPVRFPASISGDQVAALRGLQEVHLAEHARLWDAHQQAARTGPVPPVVQPEPGDRRFAAPAWAKSPAHDYLRQAYLLNARFLQHWAEQVPVADARSRQCLQFAMRQYVDAMSPANFLATNPEAIELALDTQGESLTQGLLNLIGDVGKGRISMSDDAAFEVGRNLATTPGAVVHENELMQLLQYSPLAPRVHQRPLLIVPPCINKYYILDLQPENSFVRYALEQGFTVFLVSWRNPGPAQAHLGWDDYLQEGVLRALDCVRRISGEPQPNVLGFCVGGTLLACALAVAAARGDAPVASVTLLTTMLDFADTGDIACFIDEASVAAREAAAAKGELMRGRELAQAFSTLRPNDLIWNYVADNYLKGKRPQPFDLLFWNADCTNLPGPFAATYLRHTYLENRLREPGAAHMLGQPLDLRAIRAPVYFLATREDHIVPWQSVYRGRALLGGDSTFVLGASGHIAGVVNPPARGKRSFWTSPDSGADAQAWLAGAVETRGSWWPHWSAWLSERAGARRKAVKRLGSAEFPPGEAAPGRYVRQPA